MADRRARTYAGDPINPGIGEGRYQDALRRMLRRLKGGLPLILDDSNDVGNKYTHCSWGLCSRDPIQWPDENDHVFPADFISLGRITGRNAPSRPCPFDRKPEGWPYGCFYRCDLFKPTGRRVARAEAIERYEQLLALRVDRFGAKTVADDGETAWYDENAAAAEKRRDWP